MKKTKWRTKQCADIEWPLHCSLFHAALLFGWLQAAAIQAQTFPDHPLAHPAITQGVDGAYYLTGTDGSASAPEHGTVSFENNDGIRLWRSKDLKSWEPLGRIFDMVTYPPKPELTQPWWRFPAVRPGEAFSPLVRGAWAPEYYEFGGKSLIVFSLNGQGVGILKADKPEGPYELLCPPAEAKHGAMIRPIVHAGGSPSLFADEDGAVYLLWGRGWIAPLVPDCTKLAEEPRQLRCAAAPDTPGYPWTVGREGFHLLRYEGRYLLVASELEVRDGRPVRAVYAAASESLFGPYGKRQRILDDADEVRLFNAPDGTLHAVYAKRPPDWTATERPVPTIVPVQLKGVLP